MKKYLLLFAVALFTFSFASAQYYYSFADDGQNPKGVNTEDEPNNPANASGWTMVWNGTATETPSYTAKKSIPFAFEFNGNAVSNYFASNFGVVTFADEEPTVMPADYSNISLPSNQIADNSVCILGLKPRAASNYAGKAAVMTKTLGQAPYRQHWIYFAAFGEANIQTGWTHWAIVLEETTNSIYIVDMHTICVTPAAQFCTGNVKLSAGIQIDDATAISIANSPNLSAVHPQTQGQNWTSDDNSYYRFNFGTQPSYSAAIKKLLWICTTTKLTVLLQ